MNSEQRHGTLRQAEEDGQQGNALWSPPRKTFPTLFSVFTSLGTKSSTAALRRLALPHPKLLRVGPELRSGQKPHRDKRPAEYHEGPSTDPDAHRWKRQGTVKLGHPAEHEEACFIQEEFTNSFYSPTVIHQTNIRAQNDKPS